MCVCVCVRVVLRRRWIALLHCAGPLCCAVQSVDQDGKMTNLQMTSEDEQQILSEKPALRQIYEAQVRTHKPLSGFVFPRLAVCWPRQPGSVSWVGCAGRLATCRLALRHMTCMCWACRRVSRVRRLGGDRSCALRCGLAAVILGTGTKPRGEGRMRV